MNVFTGVGNIGRDAQLRATNNSQVCNFSVAIEAGFGENKQTYWVACSLWGKRAESLNQYLTKGTKVCISGEISLHSYESNGAQKSSLALNVREVTLCGSPQNNQQQNQRQYQQPAQQQNQQQTQSQVVDDIPF